MMEYVYFLGIGGIGMSALARYYHHAGMYVCGYDLTRTTLTGLLEEEGMTIHYEDNPEHIPAPIKKTKKNPCYLYTGFAGQP